MATSSSPSLARARGQLIFLASAHILIIACVAIVAAFAPERWAPWAAGAAGALLAALITVAVAIRHTRQIDGVTAAAQTLAEGQFGQRIGATRGAFTDLARALNAAAAQAEAQIRSLTHERAQLEALLNASSDATVAVSAEGNVVYLNDAARNLFGPLGERAIGRPFIEAVRDHDLSGLLLAAAQRGERSVRVVAYGPAQKWLQATAVPIEGAGHWAALAVYHDLTEVRRLEGVRRDFISNVSHELRTPLAGIRAASETLQEGALDDPAAAAEFLGHILRETDRMTQLVEELLELSRIESGAAPMHFARIDAALLIRDAADRFAQQAERAGITLRVEAPTSPVVFVGDHERLERAIGNLIANAIKFTPAGGTITVGASSSGDHIHLSVTDTGIGIDTEQQSRVFERFYKVDQGRGGGGIGLGLAIVKHITLAHGGDVAVESRRGRGSTFTMRLPAR